MAKKKEDKEYTTDEYLNTLSMSARDKWVVKKAFTGDNEARTLAKWDKELNNKCKGVTVKNN